MKVSAVLMDWLLNHIKQLCSTLHQNELHLSIDHGFKFNFE